MNADRAEPHGEREDGDFKRVAIDDFEALAIVDARVFKAGNSLAIRIPSVIAKRMGLEDDATVEVAVDDGTIYVRKGPSRELAELIDRITPQNVHGPVFDNLIDSERW